MADDKDGNRIKRTLNERQIKERTTLLIGFHREKRKLEAEKTLVADQVKGFTHQIDLLEQQIDQVSIEIDEKAAWIPKQLALGEDPAAEPVPGASGRAAKKTGKKKPRRNARANGVDDAASDLDASPPDAA